MVVKAANSFGPYISLESSDRDDLGTVEELRLSALQRYQDRHDPISLAKVMTKNNLCGDANNSVTHFTKIVSTRNKSQTSLSHNFH